MDEQDYPNPPGRHDHEPPLAVAVTWYCDVPFRDYGTGAIEWHQAPCSRVFGAESWRWKHAKAWRDAMARKYGYAFIEEIF